MQTVSKASQGPGRPDLQPRRHLAGLRSLHAWRPACKAASGRGAAAHGNSTRSGGPPPGGELALPAAAAATGHLLAAALISVSAVLPPGAWAEPPQAQQQQEARQQEQHSIFGRMRRLVAGEEQGTGVKGGSECLPARGVCAPWINDSRPTCRAPAGGHYDPCAPFPSLGDGAEPAAGAPAAEQQQSNQQQHQQPAEADSKARAERLASPADGRKREAAAAALREVLGYGEEEAWAVLAREQGLVPLSKRQMQVGRPTAARVRLAGPEVDSAAVSNGTPPRARPRTRFGSRP